MTVKYLNLDQCLDEIIAVNGYDLVVGAPLGIGKSNHLLNALWQKAKNDPQLKLEIFTALSLQVPRGRSLLEKRLLNGVKERLFKDYPELEYIKDLKKNTVPDHMKVTEFYMQSGKMLSSHTAQQCYTSSNYTHVVRDMLSRGMNVLIQMVAIKKTSSGSRYSLSSNTDLTLDVITTSHIKGMSKPFMVAVINPHLPFMPNEAEVDEDFFDVIVDEEHLYHQPFATPRASVNLIDYSIGLMASTLIKDGGTLQVGIGSLGDAVVYSTQLRHTKNANYLKLIEGLGVLNKCGSVINSVGALSKFNTGLYAASEMFVEGFVHLYESGILKRKVYPDPDIQKLINEGVLSETIPENMIEILLENDILEEILTVKQLKRLQFLGIMKSTLSIREDQLYDDKNNQRFPLVLSGDNVKALQKHCLGDTLKHGAVLHGAFFLGSPWFYQWLRDDKPDDLFHMTSVSQVNELYGGEVLDRVQRVKARFINTCMKVDLLGAAASDTLDNQQVVSGVGGQYNFVSMAHALHDSRSILMLRSTHQGSKGIVSNIVWKYPYCTIPRHLRDIVVTEYGIADLRGQSDQECIKRMLCIADARFQEVLRKQAVKYGKLDPGWSIPDSACCNTPLHLQKQFNAFKQQGFFPEYPFGSDFTEQELVIIDALKYLKKQSQSRWSTLKLMAKAFMRRQQGAEYDDYMNHMDLHETTNLSEKIARKMLMCALKETLPTKNNR